ncbi:putative HIT-like protein [Nymphon striatum]|nr:putative HIT-like protein [Nymphon striatum]
MTHYNPDNIFTKIMAGDIPCHKVYEDDETFVFMDINPRSDGHCLVIPKAGSRNLLDAAPMTLGSLISVTQKIAQATKQALNADGIMIDQFNEAPAGQSVFHLHFHVVPRYENVPLKSHGNSTADHELLAAQCEKIKAAL